MPAATQGSMKSSSGVPLPLIKTQVHAKVNGPIADVQVQQVFKNHTSEKIEATYSFPLSHEGSVCRFNFKLGDRVIMGVIKEKEEAKKTYEAAKARGQAATLLEQNKENLFTMSVANIQAGEVIEVNMGYQEKIPFDDGEYRFIFPLVATEDYDGTGGATSSTPTTGPNPTPTQAISASDKKNSKVDVQVTINPGIEIETPKSLSHNVGVTKKEGIYEVKLAPADSIPNQDFVIAYKLVAKDVEPVLYFEKPVVNSPASFVMVLTPPADKPLNSHAPLDVVFMVDRSYSMRGQSLAQCARAVAYLLEPLNEQDGVQLVAFDHDMESFDTTSQWRDCNENTKGEIRKFVEGIKPRGGTELEYALHAAMAVLPNRPKREKIICLLTDAAIGDLTRAKQLCANIVASEHTRLYVLGVGPSVNRFAVSDLAKKAAGVSEVLLPSEKDVSGTLERFRRRLLEAGPAIQNLSINWDKKSGLEIFDIFPSVIPDLFTGQPLQVCGQYSGASGKPVKLTITGNNRDGSEFCVKKEIVFPNKETFEGHAGVQRTWAKFKIDELTEKLPQEANQDEAKFQIIALSFQNVLMCKFTSFVAEEEDPNEKPIPIKVEQAKSGNITIEGLKPSDKAKSVLLRAAIAFHASYTGSAIVAGGNKRITFQDNTTKIEELDLKNLEFVSSPYQPPSVNSGIIAPSTSRPRVKSEEGSVVSKLKSLFSSSDSKGLSKDKDISEYKKKSTKDKKKSKHEEISVDRSERKRSATREMEEEAREEGIRSIASDEDMKESESLDIDYDEEDCDDGGDGSSGYESYAIESELSPPAASMAERPASMAERPALAAASMAERPALAAPCAPAPRPSSLMSESVSSSSRARRSTSGDYKGSSQGPRVLVEVKKKRSAWTPENPWLKRDDAAFLQMQKDSLPKVAFPTSTTEPDTYSKSDTDYVITKPAIGEMDLAFVVDETGSMGGWIRQVQQEIQNIITSIQASPLCKNVRVGLVGYRDHPPQDQMVVEVLPLTDDLATIKNGVDNMYASGGGDGPECMTDGMYEAVRLNWRPTAAKVVVVITDAPPHGLPDNNGDGFPNGCPCGRHWYAQAACMREMGIVCYTVGCGISGTTELVYRTIANVTNGLYVNLRSVMLLIPLITGAAETALDRQRLQELLFEVVRENLEELQRIEDEDALLNELLKRLRAKNVRLRALSVHTEKMGMHYEDLTLGDVQLAFEDLRRSERVAL